MYGSNDAIHEYAERAVKALRDLLNAIDDLKAEPTATPRKEKR
jgi:hypothetical protein